MFVEEMSTRPTQAVRNLDFNAQRPVECIVGGAHAFILRISSFFGLAPLRFVSHPSGYKITVSKLMCVYSYILMTILATCTILGIVSEINAGVDNAVRMSSKTTQVVFSSEIFMVLLTAAIGVYGAPKRMKSVLKCMRYMTSVDRSVGGQYSIKTERKMYAILFTILISVLIIVVDDFCFHMTQALKTDKQWKMVTNYVGFYVLSYMMWILVLQFSFTALCVGVRFTALNHALAVIEHNFEITEDKQKALSSLNMFAVFVTPMERPRRGPGSLVVNPSQSRESTVIIKRTVFGEPRLVTSADETIRRIASLHSALCDAVHRVNDCYSLPLVVILISLFLQLLDTVYFLILEIKMSTNQAHFYILQSLWCTIIFLRMLIIVESGHYIVNEGKRTEWLVCRLMNAAPPTGSLTMKLQLFSKQLMLHSARYTPLGLCTLDRPLLVSMIGAITTYLVILLQFQTRDK